MWNIKSKVEKKWKNPKNCSKIAKKSPFFPLLGKIFLKWRFFFKSGFLKSSSNILLIFSKKFQKAIHHFVRFLDRSKFLHLRLFFSKHILILTITYAWYFMYRNCVELFSEVLKGPISMTCKSGFDIWTWEAIRKSNFCKKKENKPFLISDCKLYLTLFLFHAIFDVIWYRWISI